MRALLAAAAAALALTAASSAPMASAAAKPGCPAAWAKGWQALANRVGAPVYCPTWMPNPLDGQIKGQYIDIYSIGKDRSYLVSFLEHGDLGSGDVHVNFRGYPGRTAIPRCPGIVKKSDTVPCFGEPVAHMRSHGIDATVYQVNQGADQWHIALGWHYKGSLYTVSEHVIPPYRFSTQVKKNLAHLLNGLVLVRPTRG